METERRSNAGHPRRLTSTTICGDLGWHEEIHEDIADHYRAGVARLPRLARQDGIATGRAGCGGRI